MYGACALEQDDTDKFDWLPRVVDSQSFNAPHSDHTLGRGGLIHMKGYSIVTSLPIIFSQRTKGLIFISFESLQSQLVLKVGRGLFTQSEGEYKRKENIPVLVPFPETLCPIHPLVISLCHSVNGDFCDHSGFVIWHQNLITFVSWTLAKSEFLGEGSRGLDIIS